MGKQPLMQDKLKCPQIASRQLRQVKGQLRATGKESTHPQQKGKLQPTDDMPGFRPYVTSPDFPRKAINPV